jgi:hypothetical protein
MVVSPNPGTTACTNTCFFTGFIDDFTVFDRALSVSQLDALFAQNYNLLVSEETSIGETWTVEITPNDGYENGALVASNSVTIESAELLVEYQNSFVNYTTAHSFNVTAGFSYATGAQDIFNVSISSSSGSCSNSANVTNGIYLNTTFTCTGTPYVSSTISITACDAFSTCVSTTSSANAYPNQAPVMKNLLTPTDGNDTLINRLVNFTWEASTDAENDSFNYTINVTNGFCQDRLVSDLPNVTAAIESYQFPQEFNTSFECSNNEYFWQIRACDNWDCSAYTAQFNFSIVDYLNIAIVNNEINFSSLTVNNIDNTTDDAPLPFTFENAGNIYSNLEAIQSVGLWAGVSLNTSFYQHKIDNGSEAGSFDWGSSYADWLNITTIGWATTLIQSLDYNDSKDTAEVEILIQVPPAEPSGAKTDTLTFVWGSS